MFSRFFIDRPIFAWVLAIIVMIAGAIALTRLPVAQYPDIAPPTVIVSATYLGASAKVVEESVTQIIEQGMKGLDGLLYMSSTSESSGQAGVMLTFESGTDPDIAQVQVQNKLQLVTPLLPQIVQQQGVNVSKTNSSFLMVVGFVSEDGRMGEDDCIGSAVRWNRNGMILPSRITPGTKSHIEHRKFQAVAKRQRGYEKNQEPN